MQYVSFWDWLFLLSIISLQSTVEHMSQRKGNLYSFRDLYLSVFGNFTLNGQKLKTTQMY